MYLRKKAKEYKVGDKYVKTKQLISNRYFWHSKCSYCDSEREEKRYIEVRYRPVPEGAKDLKIVEHHMYKIETKCPRCGLVAEKPRIGGGPRMGP